MALIFMWGCGNDLPPARTAAAQDTVPAPTQGGLLAQAKEKKQQGDVAGAIQLLDQLLAEDPTHIAALGNRASLLSSQGKDSAALKDLNFLLDIDPANASALQMRAELLRKLGKDSLALADFDRLLVARADDPVLQNARGAMRLQMGQAREALADFQAALQKRPGWKDALLNRAAAYYALGEFKLAEIDYSRVLANNPSNSAANNGLGLILQFANGDIAGADVQYRKALHHDPLNAEAWYNVAYLEASQGKTLKAIDDFGEAIRLDSGYVDAYLNRGVLYMNMRLRAEAIAHFQMAVDLRPSHSHARLLLGWARCEAGEKMKGCIELSTARELGDPDAAKLLKQYCK